MKDLLDKLSSYNLFNYLLPGVLFSAMIDGLTDFKVIQENIVIGVFVYYFLGSVVSRIGSLLLEPLLKKVGFLTFSSYPDFIAASKKDTKIDLLSEANNMYRTFVSLFLTTGFVVFVDRVVNRYYFLEDYTGFAFGGIVFTLYLFAYRKQTSYITRRVQAALK